MADAAVARVVIESALPQLGGEYDYLIPTALQANIEFGCRVAIPIGRSKQLATGFVVGLLPSSEFARREISQLLGPAMLTPELLECCRLAARRQVVSLGEFLRAAAPAFMPTLPIPEGHEPLASPEFHELGWKPPAGHLVGNGAMLSSATPALVQGNLVYDWATLFLSAAAEQLRSGESSLLIVPEESDFEPVQTAAKLHGIAEAVITLQDKRKAARYRDFWQARNGAARIYLGTRSAVLHPASKVGLIAIYDDLDESLRSKATPYIHARELALIRAQTSKARVLFAAPYRSLEVQRLVKIGFATELVNLSRPPRMSHFETQHRLPSEFFALARTGLESGPVLVLVPSRSWSAAARCESCQKQLRCGNCSGPALMPAPARAQCRLCSAEISACAECGSRIFQAGRPGAVRIASELGRAFPGHVVRDFSGEAPKTKVGKHDIVVATPSAAPRIPAGYAAAAVIDCPVWLNRPSLRAEQFAIRDWQEAFALLKPGGRAALFGVPSEFGRIFAVQDFVNQATTQLREMTELRFPPAWRICSVSGVESMVTQAAEQAIQAGAEVVRRSSAGVRGEQAELLLRFRYQDGLGVADALQELAIRSSLKGSTAGRRRLKIAMDDLGEL